MFVHVTCMNTRESNKYTSYICIFLSLSLSFTVSSVLIYLITFLFSVIQKWRGGFCIPPRQESQNSKFHDTKTKAVFSNALPNWLCS